MEEAAIKIPAELFALAESSRFEGTYDLGQLQVGPDDYTFASPVKWVVDVTNTGSALLVSGLAQGSATCACSRCLEEVAYDFEGSIEGYFLLNGESVEDVDDEGEEIGEDEFEALPADHIIDLRPLITAALMVDADTMPLCREDCAGLCPQCGANLNEGECGCGEDGGVADFNRAANPFSVLADFRFED